MFRTFIYCTVCLLTTLLLTACASKYKFDRSGLQYLSIGEEMPDLMAKKYKGINMRDTLFQEGEYQWPAAILDYKDGKVYIEEDFLGNGTVNRIRIQSPSVQFDKRIYPGMTAKEVQDLGLGLQVLPIPSYKVLDVSPVEYPEIHLLFPVDEAEKAILLEENISFDRITHTAKVKAIVIM